MSAIISELRNVTEDLERARTPREYPLERPDAEQPEAVWKKSKSSGLCVEVVKAHMSSYSRGSKRTGGQLESGALSGMVAAMELYMAAVLDMLDVKWKSLRDLAPYIVSVIVRDLRDEMVGFEEWDGYWRDL